MVRIHAIQGLGIVARRGSSPLPVAAFGDIPTAKNRQLAEQKLVALLKDKSAEIRAQALRALADSNIGANEVPLGPLLGDESPRVRYFTAILAGKRNMVGYYGPICEMIAENNNRDIYLRHAGIFALQQMARNKPGILMGLVQDESPAVRLAAVVALRRMKSAAVTTFIHDADPKVVDEAIRAVGDLDLISARPDIAALLDDLTQRSWSPFMLRRLIHNAFRVGTLENATRLLKIAADPALPDGIRVETIRLLTTWTEPFPVDQLTGNWRPLEKRPLSTLRPALLAALPSILKQDGLIRPAAISLAKQYQLDTP
jgi:quinoprotein glucose dehydrogenase